MKKKKKNKTNKKNNKKKKKKKKNNNNNNNNKIKKKNKKLGRLANTKQTNFDTRAQPLVILLQVRWGLLHNVGLASSLES